MGRAALVGALLVAASCSSGEDVEPGGTGDAAVVTPAPAPPSMPPPAPAPPPAPTTLPLAEQALDDPDVTSVATDLAPSQITGSTVAVPDTPPPCTADDLEVWTARIEPRLDGPVPLADAVIRVRNVSAEWCEPDIGRSPLLDPAIEPDVWLLPGGEADLHVGQRSTTCEAPSLVPLVQIGIGTESLLVPSAVISCEWWLDAFVPLERPGDLCRWSDLRIALTDDAVVAATRGSACVFAAPDLVAGAERVAADPSAPKVEVLHPGDVVALGAVTPFECADPPPVLAIGTEGLGTIAVLDPPCGVEIRDVPSPWFGTPDGPTASMGAGELDLDAAFAAMDPFAGRSSSDTVGP